jgi:integrase
MDTISTKSNQHTPGHFDCPVCSRTDNMQDSELTPQMSFAEAFDVWIALRVIENQGIWAKAKYISKRTEHDLKQYKKAAAKFFLGLPLEKIHLGHLREYQKARALNLLPVDGVETHPWEHAAGANLIRKEVGTVIRVLRAAGLWTPQMDEDVEKVEAVVSDVPRAMSPEEQHAWLHTAASRMEWRVVYWWSIVALQTTASTNELRALRLGNIFLNQGALQIQAEGAKNKYRVRTIPFQSPEIIWALSELMDRARRMGASGPQHYLFPKHITADRYDPNTPMTVWGIRKPWEAARSAAGLPWLRVYDLRHTAITRMAEAGVPVPVIMNFAGHIREEMQRHYTTISMNAMRRAAAAAWGNPMAFMPQTAPGWPQALPQGQQPGAGLQQPQPPVFGQGMPQGAQQGPSLAPIMPAWTREQTG